VRAALLAVLTLMAPGGILGRPAPEWGPHRWVQGGPLSVAGLRGHVVLVRFFMSPECPLCRGTAPSLNELYREFGPSGLVVVGMFTPKPRPRPTRVEDVQAYVEAYGFRFPVAVDDDWSALRALWLDRVPDAEFTSSSLLIDKEGVVRHVHPGGVFARDGDAQARRDYDEMRAAIQKLLAAH
jgi:thiol-disulfide isomerase/thioredoxin